MDYSNKKRRKLMIIRTIILLNAIAVRANYANSPLSTHFSSRPLLIPLFDSKISNLPPILYFPICMGTAVNFCQIENFVIGKQPYKNFRRVHELS